MVTFADLHEVDPQVFRQGERAWQAMSNTLGERAAEVRRVNDALADWEGEAATAAKAAFQGHSQKLDVCSDTLFEAYRLWGEAADRIGAAHRRILDGAVECRYWGLTVTADGTIHDDNARNRMADEPVRIREVIAKYTGVFRDAVAEATAADTQIAASFRRLTAEAVGAAPGSDSTTAASATVPARGTSPVEVKQWWDSLSPMEQESLLFTRSSELGMLDGIPAEIRDRANRFQLVEERAELDAQKQRLETLPSRTREQELELTSINEKLGGLHTIEKRLTSPQSGQQQAYLLGIDSSGNGRAIVAIGNPDTAANVATFVPGTGARLGTCGTDIGRSDSMVDAAEQAGSPSTASITWIGYDAPQDLVDAADEDYAQNARQDLDRFQDGLRATHEGTPSHNTVIGHSYGSTVIGHTARDMNINADDVVFVGSPGTGVSRAEDLNLPPENVHSTVAKHDVIQVTNVFKEPFDVHGPDPAGPMFGGNVFTSDPGTSSWTGYSTEAHSQYWDRENQSLDNMGRIIAGKPTT